LFTVLPVGTTRPDGPGAVVALRWLPAVGALLGAIAALAVFPVWHGHERGSPLLGAVVAIGLLAAGTRGMHLDGLADLADGLGSGHDAARALRVMRQSDIGPFGVAAVVFAVLCQVASLATLFATTSWLLGSVYLLCIAATGRLAVVWAAARGVPAAHRGGFGVLVANSAGVSARLALTAAVLGAGLAGAAVAGASVRELGCLAGSILGALVVSKVVSRHAVRRLGGVTGDVFGALVEITTTACTFTLAVTRSW
jgi:adenosylcobinamide-GDP ribazoletransferase